MSDLMKNDQRKNVLRKKFARKNYLKSQRGLTLMEVLIAMAFIGVLATLAYSLQLFGLKSFMEGGNQANIQQNVRIASEVLRSDLKNTKSIAFQGISQPIAADYEGYHLESDRLVKSDTNFSTDQVIKEITITLEGMNGRVMLVYEIKAVNDFTLKDQILLNNFRVEDVGDEITLGKVYSLGEHRLVFTQ